MSFIVIMVIKLYLKVVGSKSHTWGQNLPIQTKLTGIVGSLGIFTFSKTIMTENMTLFYLSFLFFEFFLHSFSSCLWNPHENLPSLHIFGIIYHQHVIQFPLNTYIWKAKIPSTSMAICMQLLKPANFWYFPCMLRKIYGEKN